MAVELLCVGQPGKHHKAAATQARLLLPAVPELAQPIRLALNTLEPWLVGHMLRLINRLLLINPHVGHLLAPHFTQWVPAMSLFFGKKHTVILPPPACIPPAGPRGVLQMRILKE